MAGAAITQADGSRFTYSKCRRSNIIQSSSQIMANDQQAMLANTQNNLNADLANTSNRQQMALAKLQALLYRTRTQQPTTSKRPQR